MSIGSSGLLIQSSWIVENKSGKIWKKILVQLFRQMFTGGHTVPQVHGGCFLHQNYHYKLHVSGHHLNHEWYQILEDLPLLHHQLHWEILV